MTLCIVYIIITVALCILTEKKVGVPVLTKRNDSLDIAKGLGMMLVVFGHLTYAKDPERTLVYSFHMPMFLILSGYFFKQKPVPTIFTKGARHFLLAAYATLMIDIPISFYTLADKNAPMPTGEDWVETFLLYDGLWRNLPVWYLFAMVLCQAACAICSKGGRFALAAAMVAVAVFNLHLSTRVVWWPISTLFAFPFFALGVLLQNGRLMETVQRRWKLLTLPALAGLIAVAYSNGYTDMYSHIPGKSYLLFIASGLLGTVFLIGLSTALHQYAGIFADFLSYLGKHTFVILITHYNICRWLVPTLLDTFNKEWLAQKFLFQASVTCLLVCLYCLGFLLLAQRKQRAKALANG